MVYTVSQVNKYIKMLLEDDILLDKITIKGEVYNFKAHSSGHLYFTLKDEDSYINCIMYSRNVKDIYINIRDGSNISCDGKITGYPKNGIYNLNVDNIEIEGYGKEFLDFEALKQKFEKEGLFDKIYKKDIPKYPKLIGVITSLTSAAFQDILKVARDRNVNTKIAIIPAIMQGKLASKSIIESINIANEYKKLDVIILARGGGSKEDLFIFNEESICRAIFESEIPIVTGIGHEIDFTLADFVADMRTATPSTATQVCLSENYLLKISLENTIQSINNSIIKTTKSSKQRLINYSREITTNVIYSKIQSYKNIIDKNANILNVEINLKNKTKKLLLQNIIDKLEDLSPLNILKKGYTAIYNEDGQNLKSKNDVNIYDNIYIKFYDGDKKAKIIE